jgi:signal transduction histidine kinase
MDRIELLRILSSQAAIAIDNARLYGNLEEMVMQRTSELEVARGQVAQIAEVATGVLHNIGNLVNSVNISNDEIAGVIHWSKIDGLEKANELLAEHRDRLAEFLTSDERGKLLPEYYMKIEEMIRGEHEKIGQESKNLTDKISVMRDIIVTQQEYARIEQPADDIDLKRVVEDALIIQQGFIIKRGIVIVKNFSVVETVKARKSQLIHVLLNLFKNASDAMMINDEKNRVLSIDIGRDDAGRKYIRVGDNGEGIEPENLEKIFTYGFTTKKEGHGFGLNMSFRFISDIGGQIIAESGGRGKGSVFTIYLK